ncbi:MAG: homoserine dehydrogenase, partial [Dehalococcoidia bacterium]|nr:homoserine dehydrogenase [Dehalococcoidia bacterium]
MSESDKKAIGMGLLGVGVVGGGTASALMSKENTLAWQIGCPLSLKKVLVRDLSKKRQVEIPPEVITTEVKDVLNDPEID